MKKVALLVRDFKVGTKMANAITFCGAQSFFPDLNNYDQWEVDILIVELDDKRITFLEVIKRIISERVLILSRSQ